MAKKHHPLWTPTDHDRAVASALGEGAAFVPLDGGIGYTRDPPGLARSPVLDLIQAVYEACPGRAHTVLRQRIRVTGAITPFDRAVVEVAAKRLGRVPPEGTVDGERLDLGPWATLARERGRAALFAPGGRDGSGVVRVLATEGIVAVLVDPSGQVVLGAWNAAETNRTLHAELNLVQGWVAATGEGVPAGSRIVTSLQPCRMCAAMMVWAALGPIRVEYLAADPGRLATRTALQALGWEHSIPRRRADA